jgi:DNA polymerase
MESRAIKALRVAAEACTDCPLYARATQVVFGAGPAPAPLMMIGEQPGDREDRAGTPFVGPAGVLLDEVLDEAGIDRDAVYLTNAVKHFKWRPGSGKVRLHQSPNRSEVAACAQWWQAELDAVAPAVVVALGAIAAKALLGPSARVTQMHGQAVDALDRRVVATLHPAAVLRAGERRAQQRRQLVDDLTVVASMIAH